ncbi:MAG: agmatinase [Bacteroidota bacterium]
MQHICLCAFELGNFAVIIMEGLSPEHNFLGITEPQLYRYQDSKVVIQQIPYEHTSSYVEGSAKGPAAVVSASHYVEFYDEMLGTECYRELGICTLPELQFHGACNREAVDLIKDQTRRLLQDGKYVVSLGAEHTVTLGFVEAFLEQYPDLHVVQIDAHSDLRLSYHDNPFSHASVMARVHDLGVPLVQVGIRAQCREEAELIRNSDRINTWYAHQIQDGEAWMDAAIAKLGKNVYLTIDADGFDPSVVPAVGTAEPGGLTWWQGCRFLQKLAEQRNIVGFDIVEIAPREVDIISEFSMAKLLYRILGFLHLNKSI